MQNIDIAIVKSAFENLAKLNDKIYFEAQKEGYHQSVTKTSNGIQTSVYLFKDLKNLDLVAGLLNTYTYETEATVYVGKVTKMEEYNATEYSKPQVRIKVTVDNGETYSIPKAAKLHLKLES